MCRARLFFSVALILLCLMRVSAQRNQGVQPGFADSIPAWMAENKVPVVGVGFVEQGRVSYQHVFGKLKNGKTAPANTLFDIASMTKPVVAILTLKLVEAGAWSLDEPLEKYWVDPDVANDPRHKKLTTRHVLTHQTGFPNWRNGKLAFEFEPGKDVMYSGEGFEYLRMALERKFKKGLGQLMAERIFQPLGMKDTGYWSRTVDMDRYARWFDAEGKEYSLSYETPVNAANFLLTTIGDYSKFMIHVMNGAGLSPALFKDMTREHVHIKKQVGKGLGWELISGLPGGEYSLQHGGGDRGVKTMGIILPESKRAVVVFTNGDNGSSISDKVIASALSGGQQILDLTNGAYSAPVVQLSEKVLDKYVGSYVRSDLNNYKVIITREGNTLRIAGDGVPLMNLLAEKEDKFFVRGFAYRYEFVVDTTGAVTRMHIFEGQQLLLFADKLGSSK